MVRPQKGPQTNQQESRQDKLQGLQSEELPRAKPRCLIWGEGPSAPWHPLAGILTPLRAILSPAFDCVVRDDGKLEAQDLENLALLINCRDLWDTAPDPAQALLLMEFLGRGGGTLSLHNGICLARHPAFLPLLGAVFTGHPEPADLDFTIDTTGQAGEATPFSPIGFTLHEEPYRFDFPPGPNPRIFLNYRHLEQSWPAGWTMPPVPGSPGRAAYLAPGHKAEVFLNSSYSRLVLSLAHWCVAAEKAR